MASRLVARYRGQMKRPKPSTLVESSSGVGGRGLTPLTDPRLDELLGEPLSPEEVKTWAGMPEVRREEALKRAQALDAFIFAEGGMSAEDAAIAAGLKLRRFYQIVRQWRDRRSLSSLGTYGSVTKTRQHVKNAEVTNALQAVVAKVVLDNRDASMTQLARSLWDATKLTSKPPALNTLRQFVEREQRRTRQAQLAGHQLLFDLSASSLLAPYGRLWTVFLLLDEGTGLIFGHGEGCAGDSAEGYRLAAADALRRIPDALLPANIWAERMERSQIVPGRDIGDLTRKMNRIRKLVGGFAPQLTGEARGGDYIRRLVGLKLGPIRLIPTKTTSKVGSTAGHADRQGGLSQSEASARVELAVLEHNAQLVRRLNLSAATEPPEDLLHLLRLIASD